VSTMLAAFAVGETRTRAANAPISSFFISMSPVQFLDILRTSVTSFGWSVSSILKFTFSFVIQRLSAAID
ncbi:MAG: hypothetical protein ACERJ2_17485, partial [Filomicrobium sp.]